MNADQGRVGARLRPGSRTICAVLVAWILAPAAGSGAALKVQVDDPVSLQWLLDQGASVIADYGSFQALEMPFTTGELPAGSLQIKEDWNTIRLNAGPIDTRAPQIQSMRRASGGFSGNRLHLIHFAAPIKPEWTSNLLSTGVQLVSYLPNNAYLVYGNATALGRMQAWAATERCVQWEGVYADGYKVQRRARAATSIGDAHTPDAGLFAVQLLDDIEANDSTLALIDQLRLAPVRKQFRTLHYVNIVVRLPLDRLDALAARPDVLSIGRYSVPVRRDERQGQIIAGNLAETSPSGPGYLEWLESKGFSQAQFDASGFVVDVTDSGVDNGTVAPGHFGLYRFGQPSAGSRVAYSRLIGSPNFRSTLQGCDGHGTLNAHIIAGFAAVEGGFPHRDAEGYAYGLGICPFVKVGASVVFDPDFFTDPNFATLQSRAYQDGARISANSWGSDSSGEYNIDAQAFDALARDAQPPGSPFPTAGNQQMVLVFAAGNEGPDPQTMNSPGSAKNVITVGASESVRSLSPAAGGNSVLGDDGCATSNAEADNVNDMLEFSSRGPCEDGRMKPELVAPGSHVTAGVPQAGLPTSDGTGAAISCFDAIGVCALPGSGSIGRSENFFPLSQQFYTVSSGTSHAVPAAAAACALVRQYFINQERAPPSPAMTKAFLVNSVRYLSGTGANDTLWSTRQGMGALNLGTAFDGVPRILRDQVAAEKFTASGQARQFSGTVGDSGRPFRVTLAWTDAPGSTFGNAYNNDLDLTVSIGGATYRGNVFNGAFSIAGGVADGKNNLESVLLPAGVSGNFVVTVTAANINSDGVPNDAPLMDQDFALVVYNAVEANVPLIRIESQQLTAEGCNPANGVVDAGEAVTVSLALKNEGLAASSNLVVTLLSTNGVIFPSGPRIYGALEPGSASVARPFSFVATGACGTFIEPTFLLQDGDTIPTVIGFRLYVGIETNATSTATNLAPIVLPSAGPAALYPSSVTISGAAGTVSKVRVTLVRVSHTYPADIDALLVSPSGHSVMLMSDAGGEFTISNVTLTFDDEGGIGLPETARIDPGVYKPSNYGVSSDVFPVPAPGGPHGTALSVFNGTDPNGTWSLYVLDDGDFDSGSIGGGWHLSVSTSSVSCCPGAIAIQSVAHSNGLVTVVWTAVPGRRYRVEWKRDLADPAWQELAPEIIAEAPVAGVSDAAADEQRFYRVQLLP